ncbi:nonstructural protein [Microviridae sp.]|nr:nonstructural protein [Microviridae sp.]
MIHKIYTVYDTKAEAFLPPFFMHKEGMALRIFQECLENEEHQFGKHPEDYTLFYAGEFDDNLGTITQEKLESVAPGITLVKPEENK